MLEGALLVWFLLTLGAVVFVIWDQAVNTPSVGIMKVAWVLVILYTGPIGLFIYLLACRQPLAGSHDAFIAAHWKQTIGSMGHCIAGDATGIIVSAVIVYGFMLPNGIDLIVEYVSAFIVGLLVFQALFMKSMFGSYWVAVRKTFFAETVSMNTVMVGMFPTMLILMHVTPDGDNPWQPAFWGIMSMATLVGSVTAYPINSWLVAKGYKHGMMSASSAKTEDTTMAGHGSHDMAAMSEHGGHDMASMSGHGAGHHHGAGHGHGGAMPAPNAATVVAVSVATFVLMLAATAVASLFAPIAF